VKPYFIKTPGILEKIFSKYTWRFSADKKELFLTFDDGPTTKITTFVLDQLKRHKAKATFFLYWKKHTTKSSIISANYRRQTYYWQSYSTAFKWLEK
jgi:peptidoglycan/xylan/chitin deacetylase (PgdA/CDA1 family)